VQSFKRHWPFKRDCCQQLAVQSIDSPIGRDVSTLNAELLDPVRMAIEM
jgi:hypothetical protein